MDNRKNEEAQFHNKVRDEKLELNKKKFDYFTSNRKFYSIASKSDKFLNDFIEKNCKGKKVLDYCCGNGDLTISLAKKGADAYGFDISDVSIENGKKEAIQQNLEGKTHFFVMDAENLKFEDNFFDIIICSGVLHHLDLNKAFPEIARILKPDGKVICDEPLIHNPVFQLYRRLTPQVRTKWETEHILTKKSIDLAGNYFGKTEKKFFHLFVLTAVPFRNTFVFKPILSLLEIVDSVILKLPGIKWWAWQIIFVLSDPKKNKEGIEKRKLKEIEYYDREAENGKAENKEAGSRGEFDPLILGSYRFLYDLVKREAKGKTILDYGCGTGIHLDYLAGVGREVTGIDLSKNSIKIANEKIIKENFKDKAKVLLMDCEVLDFKDNSFDVVFDGGTFSSLDLDKALPELYRVLKLGGKLIGIETFGHNPITNLKRKINKILGKRTGWAEEHILKTKDFEKFRKYFKNIEVYYFHVVSWAAFPFLTISGGNKLLKTMEALDKFILKFLPFFKKYSFKVVFVLRK